MHTISMSKQASKKDGKLTGDTVRVATITCTSCVKEYRMPCSRGRMAGDRMTDCVCGGDLRIAEINAVTVAGGGH